MSTLLKKGVVLIMGLVLIENTAPAQTALDNYVQAAFEGNQSLKQKQFQLEKAMYGLKEAKSLFLPTVSLQASYVKSAGGRTIDFPIGDLLNPVYGTLNQLTDSKQFPELENASIQLNPDNFYDAKFRTVLPLVNAEIWYNREIKKEIVSQQQAAVNVYKRQLVKDVKEAYYRYYQASKEVAIYENAIKLVSENIRVNESLYRNGVKNSTSLTRAQAEKEKISTSLTNAGSNRDNARMYFNFLLNRPLDAEIELDAELIADVENINNNFTTDISKREEMQQVQSAQHIYTLSKGLQQSHLVPKLNTFLDVGSQAFDWKVDDKSRYYMWGVNLQWDLFSSNQYKYKAQQAAADMKSTATLQQQTEKLLLMQLQNAYNNFNSAFASCRSAQQQLTLAEKYYKDQMKMYKEGQLLYIELVDAQNQLVNAELQLSLAIANTRIAAAEIEKCTASYSI
jgi:outer membrane protein TolC